MSIIRVGSRVRHDEGTGVGTVADFWFGAAVAKFPECTIVDDPKKFSVEPEPEFLDDADGVRDDDELDLLDGE